MHNRNCYLPPLLRAFKAGYVPQRKFAGVKLADAIRFIKNDYPKTIPMFKVIDSDDFKYKTQGLADIFAALPDFVTACMFNVRYLNKFSDEEVVALFYALPAHVTEVWFSYTSEYREYPHLDFADVESQGDLDLLTLANLTRLIHLAPNRLQLTVQASCCSHLPAAEIEQVNQLVSGRQPEEVRVAVGMR